MNSKLIINLPISKIAKSNESQTYLAIGNVQSGKTRFMIHETLCALDADYDAVIILGGTNSILLGQSENRFIKDIRSSGYAVSTIKGTTFDELPDEKIVVLGMKAEVQLKRLKKIIGETINKKILFIDDESDFGSINTSKTGLSTLHRTLMEIHGNENNVITYLSVTATPYADIMSKDSLNFDGIIRIEPGEGYTGLKKFNKSDNYVTLSDSEVNKIKTGKDRKFLMELILKHAKTVNELGMNTSQLLINIDTNNKTNDELFIVVKNMMKIFTTMPLNSFDKNVSDTPGIFDVLENMNQNIYQLKQGQSFWDSNAHSIIIGGHLVSRGYTFEKLVTTLMLNVAQFPVSADTLLQRARWFGYRKHFNEMVVYLPDGMQDAYLEMEELNDIIWESDDIEKIKEEISEGEFSYIRLSGKVNNE